MKVENRNAMKQGILLSNTAKRNIKYNSRGCVIFALKTTQGIKALYQRMNELRGLLRFKCGNAKNVFVLIVRCACYIRQSS